MQELKQKNKKEKRKKKGNNRGNNRGLFTLVFAPGIVLAFIIVMTTIFITLSAKYSVLEDYPIGKREYSYLSGIYESSIYLQSVKKSAEISYDESIYSLAQKGGYHETPACGKYRNANYWFNSIECYPDYRNEFGKELVSALDQRLAAYNMPLYTNNYEINIIDRDIVGSAIIGTKIDLKRSEKGENQQASINVKLPKKDIDKIYSDYRDLARRFGTQYNVEPGLILGLITQESSGDPEAVSNMQAVGLGQFIYSTAKKDYGHIFTNLKQVCCVIQNGVCVRKLCTPADDDRMIAEKSIQATAEYLSKLLDKYKPYGDNYVYFALSEYNGGGRVKDALEDAKAAGLKNPTWQELLPYLRKYKSPENFRQNRDYPILVLGYKEIYDEKLNKKT